MYDITYNIIRRKRKTLGITVSKKEGVIVSAPLKLNNEQIHAMVQKKAQWILRKLKELERIEIQEKEILVTGSTLLYLGMEYKLDISEEPGMKRARVSFDGEKFLLQVPSNLFPEERDGFMRYVLQKWFREKAVRMANERIAFYSSRMGVKPNRIVLKEQKSRWGSCSSKKNVNINWRIIMAPAAVVDYIIIHELAHLIEMNHSKKFWQIVETYMPDYKRYSRWLKDNGNRLMAQLRDPGH